MTKVRELVAESRFDVIPEPTFLTATLYLSGLEMS